MATITIDASAVESGATYTAPHAAAYAALSTGTTANTVNWAPGVYRPTAGRWWGRSAPRGMTKRCTHQVIGSGTVLIDGRIYVPLVASDYVRWDAASGTWRIELYTCVSGGSVDASRDVVVWFGAETGASASDLVMGASYAAATSLANCNADGLTIAGMSAGKGIWYRATETSEVDGAVDAQVIYVWCPLDDAQLPAVQWGGIAAVACQSGAVSAGTPRYGALVFARDTAASANDPSGSSVGPGFVVVGAQRLVGTTAFNDADPSLPISDLHWDSVVMRGAVLDGFYVGSTTGSVVSGVLLDGDWSYDDHRDPATEPAFADVTNRSAIYIDEYSASVQVQGGVVSIGNSHGALNIKGTGASGDSRVADCSIIGVDLTCKAGANDARWGVITDADDCTIARCTISGFTSQGQFGGVGSLLHGNHISGLQPNTTNASADSVAMRVRCGSDTDPTSVRVRMYANYVDLTGTDPGEIWAAYGIVAQSGGGDVPAGALDARDNVAIVGTGQAALRAEVTGGATLSSNQTWVGGYTNATTQAYSATSEGAIGTGTTLAGLFSTGTVVAPTTDTAANILRRGDTPLRRPTVYGAAAG